MAAFFSETGLPPDESVERITNQYLKLEALLDLFDVDPNRAPMVRVRCDLIQDWREGRLKHFDMLGFCAIQSMLGSQPFRRITRAQIAVRMMGYPSERAFELEAGDGLKASLSGEKRVSRMIRKLHERGLIAVVRPSKRENYFSVCLSDEMLFKSVEDFKLKSIARRYRGRANDRDLQSALRQQREAVKKSF
ncbi:hypothetical protein N9E25_07605 [Verrucomicrobiales bacterium]|nr:hypothetical protein [Verrucomicrobiales bacterium]